MIVTLLHHSSSSMTPHQAAVGMLLRMTFRVLSEAHPQLLDAAHQRGVQIVFTVFATVFFVWAMWQLMRSRPSRRR